VVEKPFYHLEFDKVFPDDVYARMIAEMPEAADYRPLPGRGGGNLREDGTSTLGQDRPLSRVHSSPERSEAPESGTCRTRPVARPRCRERSAAVSRRGLSGASAPVSKSSACIRSRC